ncbi:hypothetical protein FKP32DRAFT_1761477 [Trametes sanguinea]|nr:hypothetical protein FKP32DRAFT_1761477 [Trametes sanguinea]
MEERATRRVAHATPRHTPPHATRHRLRGYGAYRVLPPGWHASLLYSLYKYCDIDSHPTIPSQLSRLTHPLNSRSTYILFHMEALLDEFKRATGSALIISKIRVLGLARNNDGSPSKEFDIPQVVPALPNSLKEGLHQSAQDNWARIHDKFKDRNANSIPLQPQEELILRLTLDDKPMYRGKRAHVYQVTEAIVLQQSNGSTEPRALQPPLCLPPLVAKIALERWGRSLCEEAEMYRALASLQGVIMPRCYGYYRRFVDLQTTSITPWCPHDTFPRSTFDIFRMPNSCASLNILLLEKLGQPPRPDPVSRSVPSGLLEQWTDMGKVLACLGVFHDDLKQRNILSATDNPSDQPIPLLPQLTRVPISEPTEATTGEEARSYPPYKWRIIDWETATFVSPDRWFLDTLARHHEDQVIDAVENMTGGILDDEYDDDEDDDDAEVSDEEHDNHANSPDPDQESDITTICSGEKQRGPLPFRPDCIKVFLWLACMYTNIGQ